MVTRIPWQPYAVRAALALVLSILCLFLSGSASPLDIVSAASDSPLPATADDRVFDGVAYRLTWDAKGSGSGEGPYFGSEEGYVYSQFSVGFQGEALIRYRWDPVFQYLSRSTLILKSNITRDWTDLTYLDCYPSGPSDLITRIQHVVNPSHGTGTFFPQSGLPPPQQRPDGSWYLKDPFAPASEFWFVVYNLSVTLEDASTRQQRCPLGYAFDERHTELYLWDPTLKSPGDLEGDDPDAGSFSRSATVESDFYGDPMMVQWHVTAERIDGCVGLTPPVEASSSVIKNLTVEVKPDPEQIPPNAGDTLSPPDPSTLTIKVTCDRVPVRNAELRVAVDAKPNSGGHAHTNAAKPRPRGYLKRATDGSYTKITKQTPSITIKTDDNGEARVNFLPGRDINQGGAGNCAGEQRGIAGTYEVTVTPTDSRFKERVATTAVEVARTDFVPTPPLNNYLSLFKDTRHPDGTSGTSQTFAGLQGVADTFYQVQLMHNQSLIDTGHAAWPIVPLATIDISLADGGLFDSGGTAVCKKGQPKVPFIPWQIPHVSHLKGTGVDVKTGQWVSNKAYKNYYRWWQITVREVGCFYGTWAREKPFHLDVNQDSSTWNNYHHGCTYTMPAATGVVASAAASPDLFTDVFAEGTDETSSTAAGQTVTYTLGLSNLHGAADAHNVVLTGTLPAGLTLVAANPPPTRIAGSRVAWDLGTLAAGAFAQTFDLATQIGAGVAAGTLLTVTAETSTTDAEATLDNNFAAALPLFIQPPGPDLMVQSDLEAVAMTVGMPVTFHLEVDNVGNAVAPNTALTLTLPASVTLAWAAPLTPTTLANTLVWPLGSLAPDQASVITVSVEVDPRLAPAVSLDPAVQAATSLTFTLNTAASAADLEPSDNADEVVKPVEVAGPDAAIWLMQGGDGALHAGQDVTLTLRYGNYGNQVAATTTVTLSLGSGLNLISAVPPPNRTGTSPVFGGGVSGWLLGKLALGATGSITVRAHVTAVPSDGSLLMAEIVPANRDILPLNNAAVLWQSAPATASRRLFLPLLRR